MKQMTINEFNKEYGVTTWGYPKYTIATEDDIGTFVWLIPNGMTIPYFCEFGQEDSLAEALNVKSPLNQQPIIRIMANMEEVANNEKSI